MKRFRVSINKRQRFVISSALLSSGFLLISLVENEARFLGIGGLTLATLFLFSWSLSEGLGKNATLMSLVMPTMFTLAVGLFWFLLPFTVFARLPVVVMYGIGLYALNTTSNIYNVSAIRKIALARAAKGVGFVLTLFTGFLLFDTFLSVKFSVMAIAVLVFLMSFLLFAQGLWMSKLTYKLDKHIIWYSIYFSYGLSMISVLLYFWPVSVTVGSLVLTVGMYVLLGLGQAKLEGRLFRETVREYLGIGILVFVFVFLATNWRG